MSSNDLQLTSSYRQILRMALPISLALLVPQLNFITNNIFLGHHSRESLAAASITGVYYLIFAAIGYGLNNGLQALISRRAGQNQPAEIGPLFNQGIYIAMLIALTGIVITWLLAPVVLQYMIHSEVLYAKVVGFLRIRIWGLPFLYIYQMRNALLVGINQSRLLIIGTLAEALSNILFDYSLIFGHLGLPALGFNGAAFASIIAEFMGMFVTFLVIRWRGIHKRFAFSMRVWFDRRRTEQILSMSAPLIFQTAISIITWEFFYLLIEHHGETELAVSNVMRNIFGFFGVFTWAFASTSNTMVSNIMGQGLTDQVPLVIVRIMRLSIGFALFSCFLINLFPSLFLGIYGQESDFMEMAIPVLRIVSLAMILMSAGTVWLNAVTGTGNSRVTLLIEFIAVTLYAIYVYLVLEKYRLPLTIGWMSEWLYWIIQGSCAFIYIRSGRWKGKLI